jgi:hypothetical protein
VRWKFVCGREKGKQGHGHCAVVAGRAVHGTILCRLGCATRLLQQGSWFKDWRGSLTGACID